MKVLVADDDPVYRHLLHSTLAGWGYAVATVNDGAAAWRILESDDAPDLMILDWVMPGLDGDQICRLIRQKPRDRYIYILLLTSKRDREDLLLGLEAGADDYLCKPFDPPELKARLATGRRILHLQNELIEAREALRLQATRDALTGAWNHAAILEILERELSRSRRENKPLGIVLGDLDHFKRINDTHGHLTGDAVLKQIANRMLAAIRPDDLVGRYGGEEFLIVLPGCDESATLKVCERIRARVNESPLIHQELKVPATISLGFTVYRPVKPANVPALLHSADVALYRAKAAGRNRVEMAAAEG